MAQLLEEQKAQILTGYTDPTQDEPLYELSDGRIVIGKFIDTDNHSHFVIRESSNEPTIEDAEGKRVARILHPIPHGVNTVSLRS